MNKKEIKKLAERYYKLDEKKRSLEEELKKIRETLLSIMKANQVSKFEIPSKQIEILRVVREDWEYDVRKLYEIVDRDIFLKLVKVDKARADRYGKEHPKVFEAKKFVGETEYVQLRRIKKEQEDVKESIGVSGERAEEQEGL